MSITEYVEIIRARWRLVVIVALVGALAGVVMSLGVARSSQATAEITASATWTGSIDAVFASTSSARTRLQTAATLATSDEVAATVARTVGAGETAKDVQTHVVAALSESALTLRITATDADPRKAVAIADAVADQVVALAHDEDSRGGGPAANRLQSIRAAHLEKAPASWPVVIGSAGIAGAIAGAVLGVFIAVWRSQSGRSRLAQVPTAG